MDSQRDLSEKVLLYDPMFDAKLQESSRKREKSKGRRIFLVAFIIVSVVASIFRVFFSGRFPTNINMMPTTRIIKHFLFFN